MGTALAPHRADTETSKLLGQADHRRGHFDHVSGPQLATGVGQVTGNQLDLSQLS